jgi:hypothetical protein
MKVISVRLDDTHLNIIQDVKNIIADEMHISADTIADSDIIRWSLVNFYHFKKEAK